MTRIQYSFRHLGRFAQAAGTAVRQPLQRHAAPFSASAALDQADQLRDPMMSQLLSGGESGTHITDPPPTPGHNSACTGMCPGIVAGQTGLSMAELFRLDPLTSAGSSLWLMKRCGRCATGYVA